MTAAYAYDEGRETARLTLEHAALRAELARCDADRAALARQLDNAEAALRGMEGHLARWSAVLAPLRLAGDALADAAERAAGGEKFASGDLYLLCIAWGLAREAK